MNNSQINRRNFAAMAAMAALAWARVPQAKADAIKIRMALSTDLLPEVNFNDARIAYRVWADQVIQKFSLNSVEVLPEIFLPSSRILQMLRAAQLECAGLTGVEMFKVLDEIDPETIAVEDYMADGMEYVILVRDDSGIRKMEDLKGARFFTQRHHANMLLELWLDLQLSEMRLPMRAQFFQVYEVRDKINEVILPLFFHKVDAVSISRRSFNTAIELNPQLGRQLRVLAMSPKVIPEGLIFRKGCEPSERRKMFNVLTKIGEVPAGRQLLALYELGSFSLRPFSVMKPTLDLVRQYERLRR